ncbi:cytochrome P450 [Nocardia mangyaensis]|uniref:cytochrome P450 n=1 Tax=Nocardia mangyaensis TaxID=2213200 RepID=UPI0026772704|nr:cytochrome P450 [Nocardia mangyaensis]MDO3647951.1 cytochrome P450 [Nocardia mangyaensis]
MDLDTLDLFDATVLDDPTPLYRTLRETAPVYRVPGTDFFLVSSWRAVTEATRRPAEFSSHLTGVLVAQAGAASVTFDLDANGQGLHVLATADAEVHSVHRGIVGPALAKRVRGLGPVVTALAERCWSEGLDGDRIDWATGIADRLPLALLAELLGLPGEDAPRLITLAYDSTEMLGGVVAEGRMPALLASAAELAHYAYLAVTGARQRIGTPRTLLDVLVAAVRAGSIDEQQAVLILVQLIGAGGESTAGLIASAARLLATDPALQSRLRERPDLIPAFLDEALRLESPFRGHHRHVLVDTRLDGVDLPAGSHLLLLWGAANRDPVAYPDPDVLAFDRPRARTHAAFGAGAHFCIGSALARLEATAAITLLLERTESFTLIDAEPPRWVPSLFVRRHVTLPLRVIRR